MSYHRLIAVCRHKPHGSFVLFFLEFHFSVSIHVCCVMTAEKNKLKTSRNSLVAQRVKDLRRGSLLWRRFEPWPRNSIHMLAQMRKREKLAQGRFRFS